MIGTLFKGGWRVELLEMGNGTQQHSGTYVCLSYQEPNDLIVARMSASTMHQLTQVRTHTLNPVCFCRTNNSSGERNDDHAAVSVFAS
jgi:hypothetical protein